MKKKTNYSNQITATKRTRTKTRSITRKRTKTRTAFFSLLSMIKHFKPSPTDLKDTLGGIFLSCTKQRGGGKVGREERYLGKKHQFEKNV